MALTASNNNNLHDDKDALGIGLRHSGQDLSTSSVERVHVGRKQVGQLELHIKVTCQGPDGLRVQKSMEVIDRFYRDEYKTEVRHRNIHKSPTFRRVAQADAALSASSESGEITLYSPRGKALVTQRSTKTSSASPDAEIAMYATSKVGQDFILAVAKSEGSPSKVLVQNKSQLKALSEVAWRLGIKTIYVPDNIAIPESVSESLDPRVQIRAIPALDKFNITAERVRRVPEKQPLDSLETQIEQFNSLLLPRLATLLTTKTSTAVNATPSRKHSGASTSSVTFQPDVDRIEQKLGQAIKADLLHSDRKSLHSLAAAYATHMKAREEAALKQVRTKTDLVIEEISDSRARWIAERKKAAANEKLLRQFSKS